MDIAIESEIVKLFVQKQYQKRLLYEINSKKEYDTMWHYFHTEQKLKKECLEKIYYMDEKNLEKYLFQLTGKKEVYYMGIDVRIRMSLREASYQMAHGAVAIVYCGNGIGYYQGEEELADTPRYILKAQNYRKNIWLY